MSCGCGKKKQTYSHPSFYVQASSDLTVLVYFNTTTTVVSGSDERTHQAGEVVALPVDTARDLLLQAEPPIFVRRTVDKTLLLKLYPELEGRL